MTPPHPDLPVGPPVDGDPPGQPPVRIITGRYVTLEPVDADAHAPGLYAISHGSPSIEALWTYLSAGPFPDGPAMKAWLRRCELSDDPLFYTVVDNQRDRPAGMVSLLNIARDMHRLEVGNIWYGAAYQRTRTNTEAAYLLLSVAFDVLGYRRVEWKCDTLNARSRAAAERLGFTFEGVFRQHMVFKGRNRDTAWYALLDGEWPAVKANMEHWLYSTDAGEQPPVSLAALNRRP